MVRATREAAQHELLPPASAITKRRRRETNIVKDASITSSRVDPTRDVYFDEKKENCSTPESRHAPSGR